MHASKKRFMLAGVDELFLRVLEMKMKMIGATGFVAMLGCGLASAAEPFGPMAGEMSANVAITNNYIFRGISQSDESWALQGGIDYSHDLGIYLGVWGSSVDFSDGDEASVEIDAYAGWAGEIGPVSVDLGAIYYWYPGTDRDFDYDYFELAASVGYDFGYFSAEAGLNFSPDYFASSDDFWYPHASVEVPLPYEFVLSAGVGYNDIEDEAAFGVPDYWDYNVGIGYNFYDFDLLLQFVTTDLSRNECGDNCDESIVLTVSRSF